MGVGGVGCVSIVILFFRVKVILVGCFGWLGFFIRFFCTGGVCL